MQVGHASHKAHQGVGRIAGGDSTQSKDAKHAKGAKGDVLEQLKALVKELSRLIEGLSGGAAIAGAEKVNPSAAAEGGSTTEGATEGAAEGAETLGTTALGAAGAAVAAGTPVAAGTSVGGILTSKEELAKLPTSGPGWDELKKTADSLSGTANIADQNSDHDVQTLAAALVYARTGDESYRAKAAAGVASAIGTEKGGRTLALARNLPGYVQAADLINLKEMNPSADGQFRQWLTAVRTEDLDGKTLVSTHEERPNNWGTHAGAARIAASLYLDDKADLQKAADVFKAWTGDASAHQGFKFGDLSWQANPSSPVGINPKGATLNGKNVDGVIPDDQRRGGGFAWPAPKENYVWEALQGATMQAEMLSRAGFDSWNWGEKALMRAGDWLHNEAQFPAESDDKSTAALLNARYGTGYPAGEATGVGKAGGFGGWLFSAPAR